MNRPIDGCAACGRPVETHTDTEKRLGCKRQAALENEAAPTSTWLEAWWFLGPPRTGDRAA